MGLENADLVAQPLGFEDVMSGVEKPQPASGCGPGGCTPLLRAAINRTVEKCGGDLMKSELSVDEMNDLMSVIDGEGLPFGHLKHNLKKLISYGLKLPTHWLNPNALNVAQSLVDSNHAQWSTDKNGLQFLIAQRNFISTLFFGNQRPKPVQIDVSSDLFVA